MQTKNNIKTTKRIIAIVILLIIAFLIFSFFSLITSFVTQLFYPEAKKSTSVVPFPYSYSDSITPFNNNILYYDGQNLQCLTDKGGVNWSFHIGGGGDFSVYKDNIVAWNSNSIFVINDKGHSSYSDNFDETIQFAEIGEQYIGIVIGELNDARVVVKDLVGSHMDEEIEAYEDLIILDLGFHGPHGEYLWSLALDPYSTVINTMFNTYEVGKMNTGSTSLGEHIAYKVLYEQDRLKIINTQNLLVFDKKGYLDSESNLLLYGWKYIQHYIDKGNGIFSILFGKNSETLNEYTLNELRLIHGDMDKRYTLPETCVGAVVYDQKIYAFSSDIVYIQHRNAPNFTPYEISGLSNVTRVIGVLDNGKIIVACGTEVNIVTMPI